MDVARQDHTARVGGEPAHEGVERLLVAAPALDVEALRPADRRTVVIGLGLALGVRLEVEDPRRQRLDQRVDGVGHQDRHRRDDDQQLPPIGERAGRELGVEAVPEQLRRPEPPPIGAPCAGVDDAHEVARSRDRVVEPDLGVDHRLREAEQLLQLVDGGGAERAVGPDRHEGVEQLLVLRLGVLADVGERRRVVAPGLAHRVGGVAVADDRPAERRGEHPRPPGLRQVPVVGDLVVVEDHVGGRVGQRPRDPGDGGPEDLGCLELLGEVRLVLALPLRQTVRVRIAGLRRVVRLPVRQVVRRDVRGRHEHLVGGGQRAPQRGAPHQQVHRQQLAVGEQVVQAVVGRETTDLADHLAAALHGELLDRDRDGAVVDREGLGEPEQLPADGVDLRQQAARQVVGVDLVAGEEELLRAPRQVEAVLGDEVVEVGHRVGTGGVRPPARALDEHEVADHRGWRDEARQPIELVAEGEAQRAGVGRRLRRGRPRRAASRGRADPGRRRCTS